MPPKRVYIAYTGGTIGMKKGANGTYAPAPGLLQTLLAGIPELNPSLNPEAPDCQVREYQPLIDSSNLTPDRWVEIADDIDRNMSSYDGFVVIHGTDTLAYTSSALSFFIESVAKPVVVTGSQIPLIESRSDGRNNLLTAIRLASNHPELTDVCVAFGSKVMRGNRVTKISAQRFDAFASPRYPEIGTVGIEIKIDRRRVRRPTITEPFRFFDQVAPKGSVAAVRLFPGFDPNIIERLTQDPLRGLVLEAYGSGNGPDSDRHFLSAIRDATSRGKVIVCVAQPLEGMVDFSKYAAGAALGKAGAVNGYDMTTEAALTKLHYLVSQNLSESDIRLHMVKNLRGELTRP